MAHSAPEARGAPTAMKQHTDLGSRLQHVVTLLERGDLGAAAADIEQLKSRFSDVGDVWALDGELAIRQRRIRDALAAVDKAAELEPELADRHIQRARCLVIAGDIDRAKAAAMTALGFEVSRLDHLLVLGGVLVRCGEHERALDLYVTARHKAPENADVYRGLASVYRFLGKAREAEEACDEAIRLDPHDYETIGLRSSLRTFGADDNHIEELQAIFSAGARNWRGEVHVAYALAKEYEDLREYDQSWEWLSHGAAVKRRHTRYDLEDDLRIFPALEQAFPKSGMESGEPGHATSEPIFIVGMPRTGSTLIERIISSHPDVQSLGELSSFSIQMMRLVERELNGRKLDRLELPARSAALDGRSLAEAYLEDVASLRDSRPRFVDKLPLNSLNIGLIHLAMPNASIVHVMRDPMDACYAMFRYLFKNGYPFSYDLEELGAYYAAYYHLMEHWRSVLPPSRMIEIRYEDVVADLPGTARSLIQQLGLPWHTSCEEFHTNPNPSTTGSASQVRRPVYSSSIGRWRRVERQLEPLRRSFVERGVPVA